MHLFGRKAAGDTSLSSFRGLTAKPVFQYPTWKVNGLKNSQANLQCVVGKTLCYIHDVSMHSRRVATDISRV